MQFLPRSPASVWCSLIFAVTAVRATPPDPVVPAPAPATLRALAAEVEATLRKDDLDAWFPRCIDTQRGGFLCGFDRAWGPTAEQPKTLVFQARMTWIASRVALQRPDLAPRFREAARHGSDFLRERMWDQRDGGFFWELGPEDQPTANLDKEKHVYGVSFAIYALANAGEALQDQRDIDKAVEAFRWLDAHAHDDKNGGYFEALYRDGRPMLAAPASAPTRVRDMISTPLGCKSMNTHVHLLESFTALYHVWPDPHLRQRLEEVLALVETRICVWPGVQNMIFTPDWRPLPAGMSYGHDVETAYLLVEACAALGCPDDEAVWRLARSLVDNSLRFGWDAANGGFYDAGSAFGGPTGARDKTWWAQAEGLNTLLLMHERFEGDAAGIYWQRFVQQWRFIQRAFLDPQHGGWYDTVSEDGTSAVKDAKSHPWKAAYHTGRAMLNVADSLNHLAAKPPDHP